MSFVYLASPYTDPDPLVREMRFSDALRHVACSTMAGEIMYSPIVHFHECALVYTMPKDFEFWQKINFAMLSRAAELHVLQLPGWENSKGVAAEIAYAKAHGIPIRYVYEIHSH